MGEGIGPKVLNSKSPKVQGYKDPSIPRTHGPGSKGQRYFKVMFKYELDSKEGPSCLPLSLIILPLVLLQNLC